MKKVLFIAFLVLIFIGGPILNGWYTYGTRTTVTFTVNKEARVYDGKQSRYMIFTDKGVYQDTDTIWYLKFNSSDIYNKLEDGKTYTVDVYGWRVPFLSWYQNIISVNK